MECDPKSGPPADVGMLRPTGILSSAINGRKGTAEPSRAGAALGHFRSTQEDLGEDQDDPNEAPRA